MDSDLQEGGTMPRRNVRWTFALLLVVPVLLAACGNTSSDEAGGETSAIVKHVKGSDVKRVILTAEAARRLGVRLTKVRSDGAATHRTAIPYSAVLYDPNGQTWTYTSPKPLEFVRKDITVDRFDGDTAILTKGPPVGAAIVSVGSTEIWGVEYGGIEED
jgi:hypothetical protein